MPCQWLPADADQFHATDDADMPTVVFIHGNRTRDENAVENGMVRLRSIRAEDVRPSLSLRDLVVAGRPCRPHPAADARLKTALKRRGKLLPWPSGSTS